MKNRLFVVILMAVLLLALGMCAAQAEITKNTSDLTAGVGLTVTEYCTINIDADKTIPYIEGNTLVITGDGTHTLTISERIGSKDGANPSYRPEIKIKSGNLVVNGYMYLNNLTISGGKVEVKHNKLTDEKRDHAIDCSGVITITGGSVEASVSIDGHDGSAGIVSTNEINISGGTVKVNSRGNGIYSNSTDGIKISGGTVTAAGEKGTGLLSSYITIAGGSVTASGSSNGIEGYIYSTGNGKVKITDGNVTAIGYSGGIFSASVEISGGTVFAKGVSDNAYGGIYSTNGTIEISNGITQVIAGVGSNSPYGAIRAHYDSSSASNLGIKLGDKLMLKKPAGGAVRFEGAGYTYIYDSDNKIAKSVLIEPASTTYTVTYKVVNGTWADGSTIDQTDTVTSGGSPANVPSGMKANTGYTSGSWDTDPSGATISADTTFTYTFEAIPTYTVTYKVVNGTWSDDSTTDKTENIASGSSPANVPTGMKASSGYTDGAWDTDPSVATITADTTFTYTFEAIPADVYTVTVTNDGNGTGTADPASGVTGTEVTLTSTPAEGYKFKEWQVVSGDVTITDNKFAIGTANVEIKAIFEKAESGDIDAEIVPKPGAPEVTGNIDEVAPGVVTAEEIAAGVKVWVEITPLEESDVPEADKKLAEATLETIDGKPGIWLDMSMFKQVTGQEKQGIYETTTGFKFTIKIPESLQKDGRTFYLVRIHQGESTILATTTGDELNGETDVFSTYLIAYKDGAEPTDSPTDGPTETPAVTPTPTVAPTAAPTATPTAKPTATPKPVPKTGDSAPLALWLGLILLGLIGIGGAIVVKSRR